MNEKTIPYKIYLEEEEIEEEEVIPLLPKFAQEDTEISGASRGTAYHKVLEVLDFTKSYDEDSLKIAIGNMIEKETELVVRMQNEGHLVCNHTFSHKSMVKKSKNEFKIHGDVF